MRNLFGKVRSFFKSNEFSSSNYWEDRYARGGNSGSGSYGQLAEFKAEIINDFVIANNIQSIVEFGCGDGSQLSLARYPKYLGLDVSITAIQQCKVKYIDDTSKSFFLYESEAFVDNHGVFRCDMSLSLDVLYHLVEQDVYESYLKHLFTSAGKFVIIYSSNEDIFQNATAVHEKHREFTKEIEIFFNKWKLIKIVENKFKPKEWRDEQGSIANFYFYENMRD